ncbi:MAG: class I SAM-dependent methyltransferase [Bacteriovorax sp.]|nr:class I SAM-dependent methyltransferase [Bacteriovorax sp.]
MNEFIKCRLCGEKAKFLWSKKILFKYEVKYFQCEHCQYLMTEEPFWLEEAYSKSINLSDTGYISRNLTLANFVSILLFFCFSKDSVFLDFAGGYGVFVRLMRDKGFDFFWEDKYTKNLFAGGFEWDNHKKLDAVTAFEVLEHLVNPLDEIDNLLKYSNTLILSTEVFHGNCPSADWNYLALNHGQHIGFFNKKSLSFIAQKYELRFYSFGGIHVFTRNTQLSAFKFYLTIFCFKLKLHHVVKKILKSKMIGDNLEMSKR